jgi:hypothetical protein
VKQTAAHNNIRSQFLATIDLKLNEPGNPTKEYYCPVGPLHAIDKWEAVRQNL